MWTCPKCAAKVDPTFEVCWRCGTSREGVEDPSFVPADAPPPPKSPLDLDMPEGDEPLPDLGASPAGELVECYWAVNMVQAKFLADQLSENGIPAVADLHDALGSMSSGPRVWVRAADLPRAKAWLDAYDQQFKTEHGDVD
jgi:hypothetical protein